LIAILVKKFFHFFYSVIPATGVRTIVRKQPVKKAGRTQPVFD